MYWVTLPGKLKTLLGYCTTEIEYLSGEDETEVFYTFECLKCIKNNGNYIKNREIEGKNPAAWRPEPTLHGIVG